jgi:dihydroneopterin aldolase
MKNSAGSLGSAKQPSARAGGADSPPDKVFLEGIRFHGFHGLTRMEREVGVRYSVDVEMAADLSAASRSDRIDATIDYRKVHSLVVEIGRRESFRLIETLAVRLADEILDKFSVQRVRVRVRKETPVLDGIVDAVGVETERRR